MLDLDCPGLQPFQPVFERAESFAFHFGEDALRSAGLSVGDITTNLSARRKFLRACHEGYDRAQKFIGQTVLQYEAQLRQAEKNLREARRNRDDEQISAMEHQVAVFQTRQLILRRIIDGIIYLILAPDEWILRRFQIHEQIHRVDPDVLSRTLDIASARNAETRYRFSVVSDLSTSIQVGDLIEIEFPPGAPRRWTVVELKGGKTNDLLSGILEQRTQGSANAAAPVLPLTRSQTQQFQRMTRQQQRQRELEKILTTDRGIDPMHQIEVRMTPDSVVLQGFGRSLARIVAQSAAAGISSTTVDECLHLIAVRSDILRGTDLGAVAHAFFHLRPPDKECLLGTDKQLDELTAMRMIPKFFDLVRHNLQVPWGMPLFVWPVTADGLREHIADLVLQRIRLFAQLDMEAFFRFAGSEGVQLTWLTGKAGEEIKQFSAPFPDFPKATGVRARLPDGTEQDLLIGFFSRIFGHLTSPRELIDLIRRFPDQERRMEQSSAE